jgi:hypothetical protein
MSKNYALGLLAVVLMGGPSIYFLPSGLARLIAVIAYAIGAAILLYLGIRQKREERAKELLSLSVNTGVAMTAKVIKGPLSLAKDLADELYALRWKLLFKHEDQVSFIYSTQFKSRVNAAIKEFDRLGNRDEELSKAAKQESHGRKEIRVIAKRLLANYEKITQPKI